MCKCVCPHSSYLPPRTIQHTRPRRTKHTALLRQHLTRKYTKINLQLIERMNTKAKEVEIEKIVKKAKFTSSNGRTDRTLFGLERLIDGSIMLAFSGSTHSARLCSLFSGHSLRKRKCSVNKYKFGCRFFCICAKVLVCPLW